jgi:hypothetical protein
MKYTKEFSVDNFKFWSGAVQVVDAFRKANMLDDLQQIIEDVFADRTPTETEINDFVWFDVPVEYMESLGIEL